MSYRPRRRPARAPRLLAATPTICADYPDCAVRYVARACADVNERVPADLGIRVIPAAEVDLLWAQPATDEDLRLASFEQRGTDLLVETPYGPCPTTSRTCSSASRCAASASCSRTLSAARPSSATRRASPGSWSAAC